MLKPYKCTPYKPNILFIWIRQTIQTQVRRRYVRLLIWVFSVCLHKVLFRKRRKYHSTTLKEMDSSSWEEWELPFGFNGLTTSRVLRGGSRISGKGVHMYKGVGVRFADFISFFLNIPWKWNNLVSLGPNYSIFIGYLKTWGREGGSNEPPEPILDPPLVLVSAHLGYFQCSLELYFYFSFWMHYGLVY